MHELHHTPNSPTTKVRKPEIIMKFLILTVLSVALVAQAAFVPNPKLNTQWENFKVKYAKSYGSLEEVVRRQNFEENTAFIAQHNAEFAAGLHTYSVAENHLADLSYEERKAMNGARAPVRRTQPETTITEKTRLPKAIQVDFRDDPCLQPVKDQGQCGSCWAFSAVGVLEFEACKATGKAVSLSEQNLVDCTWKYGNLGCNGGWYSAGYDYVIANDGIDTEASYPYHASDALCKFDAANIGATMTSYADVKAHATNMADALDSGKIINVAIDASRPGFSFYSKGIYDDGSCTVNVDHAVIVVGYGTDAGVDYWIVRNSWGGSWGQAGYIMMRRGVDMCAIEDYPQTVTA